MNYEGGAITTEPGVEAVDYAEAWAAAAEVSHRPRPIPTVMFTAHSMDAAEASQGTTERAAAAGFFAVLRKPFHLDELVATVGRAVAQTVPFSDWRAPSMPAPGNLSHC